MESISGISAFTGITFDVSTSGNRHRGNGSPRDTSGPVDRKAENTDAAGLRLSDEEKEKVRQLQERDREVRAHEQAHLSASGGLARGGASFSLRRGPDGRMYAVGGEVNIDTSGEADPDEAIAKARQIHAAANAPAEPSSQDRAVAAEASRMEAEARAEKSEETGRSSVGGPAASVSGPPQPLNRRKDAFGNPDNPEALTDPEQAAEAAREQRELAEADAMAAYLANQERQEASLRAADMAYDDMQAMLKVDIEAAYAQMQALYAAPEPTQAARPPQAILPPVDVSRAPSPAAALTAGVYPLDRPAAAIYAADPTARNVTGPGAPSSGVPGTIRSDNLSVPTTLPLSMPTAPQPSPSVMQRASRTYQRISHVATDLAPYGTGISRSV